MSRTEQRGLDAVVSDVLARHRVSVAAYVADHLLSQITDEIKDRGAVRLITAAREDEGMAVLAGSYLGGSRGVMLMQSSGFGLCVNALSSFILPYQIPVPMIVGLRGDLGEFNVAQLLGGQAVGPICRTLGIPFEAPSSLEEFDAILDGMFTTSYSIKQPVCIGLRRGLT